LGRCGKLIHHRVDDHKTVLHARPGGRDRRLGVDELGVIVTDRDDDRIGEILLPGLRQVTELLQPLRDVHGEEIVVQVLGQDLQAERLDPKLQRVEDITGQRLLGRGHHAAGAHRQREARIEDRPSQLAHG